MIDTERLDLPSASEAYARRRCLGRYQLIKHLKRSGKLAPEILEESRAADGRYASFGNGVHAAWAGQKVELDAFQTTTLEKLQRLEQMVVTDWAAGREIALFQREQRLWLHRGITPLHSGRYDVAYVTTDFSAMLIIDGKTLMKPVAPADSNDQLRELVALAHYNYPVVMALTVAILQPHVERSTSIATYDQLEAELALRLLRWHLHDIEVLDFPRVYGPWCEHCPAMQHCPEAQRAIDPILALQFDPKDVKQLVLTTGIEGSAFLRRLLTAQTIVETLVAAYKAFLAQNPHDLPGFALKPGSVKREIKNVRGAFEACDGALDLNAFLACSSVSITKLEAAYGKALGLKGKALKKAFNDQLEELINWKTDAPSLESFEDV